MVRIAVKTNAIVLNTARQPYKYMNKGRAQTYDLFHVALLNLCGLCRMPMPSRLGGCGNVNNITNMFLLPPHFHFFCTYDINKVHLSN